MTEPQPAAGTSRDQPLFMKLIRDDDGIKWGNVVIMLGLTALSGYLASKSQRAGGRIDFDREVRMKAAKAGETIGNKITELGVRVSLYCSRAYDRARPV